MAHHIIVDVKITFEDEDALVEHMRSTKYLEWKKRTDLQGYIYSYYTLTDEKQSQADTKAFCDSLIDGGFLNFTVCQNIYARKKY